MIVLWKNDQSTHTHTHFRPKQSYLKRGEEAWGGVGGWGEREEKVSGQETSSAYLNVDFFKNIFHMSTSWMFDLVSTYVAMYSDFTEI